MITPLLTFSLITHVILGIVAVAASYAVWLELLKKSPSLSFLKKSSLISFFSYLLSWLSGGYYYVVYYGDIQKPKIIAGAYPWAHKIFTEAKEHIFLFLPFTALALLLILWKAGGDLPQNELLRKGAVFLAATITVIGILIALAGIIISGATR